MAQRGRPAKKTTVETKPETKVEIESVVKKKEPITKPTIKARPKLDLDMLVACTNMTHGKLIYVSKKNIGLEYVWDNFGDVEWIELSELVSMKNSSRKFFSSNWVHIDDLEVLEFLNVVDYYKNALNVDDFDDIYKLSPTQIQAKVSEMTKGMKNSVGFRAVQLIESGELDSRKAIEALEIALGYELLER